MATYLFSHLNVNGKKLMSPEVSLIVTDDVVVVAYYVDPAQDELKANVGAYSIYLSLSLGDFYVLDMRKHMVAARFPTFEECLQWIKENPVPRPLSMLPIITIGAGLTMHNPYIGIPVLITGLAYTISSGRK